MYKKEVYSEYYNTEENKRWDQKEYFGEYFIFNDIRNAEYSG